MNHKHTDAILNLVTRYTETLRHSSAFFVFKSCSEGKYQDEPSALNVMSNTESNEFMHPTALSELNDELKGLTCSVRDLEHRIAEEDLSGDQVKRAFAEMYPPATLFSNEIKSFLSIYPALRTWLNEQGTALTRHSSHRIIMTLASSVYKDPEDTNGALDMARNIIARSRNRSLSNSTSDTQGVESTAGRSQQATSGATDS